MPFNVTKLRELREQRDLSQTELSQLAGFDNLKTITDIESGKKKARNITVEDALKAAQALQVAVSTFYELQEWEALAASLAIPAAEGQPTPVDGDPLWLVTNRSNVVKTKEIIAQTHYAHTCFAFSRAYFGHLLPAKMFDWWEEFYCCKTLTKVPQAKLSDYLVRLSHFRQWSGDE